MQTIRDELASAIAAYLGASPSGPTFVRKLRGGKTSSLPSGISSDVVQLADQIAEEAIRNALASGLRPTRLYFDKKPLGGGNTAEVVARLTLHASFAFKMDQNTPKLAHEGETMRMIKNNQLPGIKLPEEFCQAWPAIYSVRFDPPYAYLMEFFPEEDGWLSLESRLYRTGKGPLATSTDAMRWIGKVLDTLFTGYVASVSNRHRPNLVEDYVGRIRERLTKTAERDHRFTSRPMTVQGRQLHPWQSYLEQIERHRSFLDEITPPFTTVTHGDPNPGNLMLRTTTEKVEVKLIDPKEWMTGDYLFDVAKITHFLEATGPIEKPAEGEPPKAEFRLSGGTAELDYAYGQPAWTKMLVDACLERAAQFAARKESRDPHWCARYELGMAANLFGLPLGRLSANPPREDAALILFGEGMKWMDRFCSRLGTVSSRAPSVTVIGSNEVEPASLRRVRDWLREHVPGVVETEDRRGFQLLQWEPSRPNDNAKPAELSLEHEARLMPEDEREATRLLEALSVNEGRPAGEFLLPDDSPYAGLIVRRYKRESGAQSVDRYYDRPAAAEGGWLIPRQFTIRERIQSSSFMTWSSGNAKMRALNMELPFVALDSGGMTTRLEFNWKDELHVCLEEAMGTEASDVRQRNPLFIASQTMGLALAGMVPVLEHTTYRQKFGLWRSPIGEDPEKEIFVVNVDTVVAQDLKTKRLGTYWDIDISSVSKVDSAELLRVGEFAATLATRFRLLANPGTKAWRDALVTGLLEQWNAI